MNAVASFTHELGEIVEVIASLSYDRRNDNDSFFWSDDYYSVFERYGVDGLFRFFVEDQITYQMGLGLAQFTGEYNSPTYVSKYSSNWFAGNFSVRYRFF